MYCARPICADGRKEVLGSEAVGDIVEFFAVTGKENASCTRAVSDTYDVALNKARAVICGDEGLVVAAGTSRGVSY